MAFDTSFKFVLLIVSEFHPVFCCGFVWSSINVVPSFLCRFDMMSFLSLLVRNYYFLFHIIKEYVLNPIFVTLLFANIEQRLVTQEFLTSSKFYHASSLL